MPLSPPDTPSPDLGILESAPGDLSGAVTSLVDDDALAYSVDGSTFRVDGGRAGDVIVRLPRRAWDDMVGHVRTVTNLLLSDDLDCQRGGFAQLADWDPILRCLRAGIPPYDPARADFHGRDPLAAFTPDAGDDEPAEQLGTMGYPHVKAVFGSDEMRLANARSTTTWCATAPNRSRACSSVRRLYEAPAAAVA